ncbi:hypothetical protein HS5_16620 [Acidianus sp. HS-5]|nr:hypothetical protein HS5_16620 [Acidianus sp. HS-5]
MINNNNNDKYSVDINGNVLSTDIKIIDCNGNNVKKFNNVFVLFGAVAKAENNKIKIQLTLNPCDYVRGLIFKEDISKTSAIFDNCDNCDGRNISLKSFAILNRDGNLQMNSIKVYISKDNNRPVSIYSGNTEIVSVKKDNGAIIKLNNTSIEINNVLSIFRYSTPKV